MSVRTGARSALVVAVAGAVALVAILLFLGGLGDAFGRIGDVAVLVMTLALAPVMATWYELGGRTPLRPAQASLAGAIAAVLIFGFVQLLYVAGIVTFDLEAAATRAFAAEAVAVAASPPTAGTRSCALPSAGSSGSSRRCSRAPGSPRGCAGSEPSPARASWPTPGASSWAA